MGKGELLVKARKKYGLIRTSNLESEYLSRHVLSIWGAVLLVFCNNMPDDRFQCSTPDFKTVWHAAAGFVA